MAIFLCGSACCSGAETAFFSLTRRQVQGMRRSNQRLGHLVANLLDRPGDLLGALLFGNLVVNTLFFATSSVLMIEVQRKGSLFVAAIVGVVTFFALVLFGEILPKSLAYAHPQRFSRVMALPTVLMVRGLTPVVRIIRTFVSEPCLRLILGPRREARSLTADEFKVLIDASHQQGLITARQGRLLAEVIDLNLLRVRHVMKPRVDLVACEMQTPIVEAHRLMQTQGVTHLFIYQGTLDNIVGQITYRDLLLQPETPLQQLMGPVLFVPEQKTVESLLQFFRKMRVDTVAVVDEYGGVAGAVQIEDVAETLFGPLDIDEQAEPMEQVGPFQYRLAGSLPIHEWASALGIELEEAEVASVGGWVTTLLGRIPRAGDEVVWQDLYFKVEAVKNHRIETLILTIGSHD
ncbi:hemolysin family protein [Planctomycetota bacterium]